MESLKIRRTTTCRQFNEMVEQMKGQPDIARSLTKQSPELVQEFWENLAETLNSLGPPFKEISEWKKVWSDFKSSIKKKLAINNKRGGGEEFEEQFFTTLEDEVIQLVSLRDCIEGVPQARSYGMPKKRKLGTSSTADSPLPVSPTTCFEEKPACGDMVPNEVADVLTEFGVAHEDENSRNLNDSTSKKRYSGKTSSHTQLLEDQIGLQKKLYEKVSVVLTKNVEQSQNLNTNIEKIFFSLDRLGEHEAKRNDILQSLLEETKRHNRRMEKLVMDKEEYLTDSMSE